MATSPVSSPARRPSAWIVPSVLVVGISLGVWYVLTKSTTPAHTNTVVNTTTAAPVTSYASCVASGRAITEPFTCTLDDTTYVHVANAVRGSATEYKVVTSSGRQLLENSQAHFSVVIPSGYSQAPDSAVDGRILLKHGDDAPIVLSSSATTDTAATWGDHVAVGDVTLGGLPGKKFEYTICDGPGCTSPIIAYVAIKNGIKYGVEFYGDKSISPVEQGVLDSFTIN
jgi:hypothetical protein